MADPLGTLFSPWQLEQAVISLLQTPPVPTSQFPLLVYYLASVERQSGLAQGTLKPPPGPRSYRGGVDAQTMTAEWFPMVTVEQRVQGDAVRLESGTYGQNFEVQVVSTVGDDNEDTARMIALGYGTAIAGLVFSHADLGIGATQTLVTRYPEPELLNPQTARQVCRSTVTFTTFIAPVLTRDLPQSWPASPYALPAGWPQVTSVNVNLTAVPESQQPLGTSG